jgi:hypothetical protein
MALSVLPAAGIPIPRSPEFRRRYGKATTVVDESGIEIDVHTTLTHGYFGPARPLGEPMENPDRFEIGDVEMLALDRPNRLLHAANHVGVSEYIGMHSTRDIPQLVLVAGFDWRETIERATRWKVDGLLAAGPQRRGECSTSSATHWSNWPSSTGLPFGSGWLSASLSDGHMDRR